MIEEEMTDTALGNRTVTYTGACPERSRRNPAGNRLEKDDNGLITTYTYDDNDRLLTEACPEQGRRGGYTYTYDNTCPELAVS